ncbi:hypothetical protein KAR02_01550 [Candidatus Bipolaricaulota bacterium]|nr:hypothetical protein [Candidatus Bipolaricaulota bacterium]
MAREDDRRVVRRFWLTVMCLVLLPWSRGVGQPGFDPSRGITFIESLGVGRIAVHIQQPERPRYEQGAPVIVNVSGFFTSSSGFDFEWEPDTVGVIYITYLWPGKSDPRTGQSSGGVFDYGGPNCLAALRDVIRFATGEMANAAGQYLHELVDVVPLYEVSGLYAFSHSGIVATNVLALHGEALSRVKFFVGRENPTLDAMYPLEPGHWADGTGRPVHNPFYDPAGYTPTSIEIDYSTVYWSDTDGLPAFRSLAEGEPDFLCSSKHPRMWDKDYWSTGLLQALLDNGALTRETWPQNLATPEEAAEHWPFRTTVDNYPHLTQVLPDLKVMLVFASEDHVQVALDKPHIHQAYDGFNEIAGLWCRLNPDRAYVESFIGPGTGDVIPDNAANTEPSTWAVIRTWGYRTPPTSLNKQVPLAAISEMCDRTMYEVWANDLSAVLHEYCLVNAPRRLPVNVRFPEGTCITASPLSARQEDASDRDFGLYMDPAWAPTWNAELIDWPDFGLPADWETAANQIVSAFEHAKNGERVEIGCIGGLGRTGTVLACMAILAGVPVDQAVEWARANYDSRAVETLEQAEWVLWFGRFIRTQS